jgi:hypothetical protein
LPAADNSFGDTLATGDVNNDGQTDILTASLVFENKKLVQYGGADTSPTEVAALPPCAYIYAVALADVDNDQRDDVIVGVLSQEGEQWQVPLMILRSRADGTWPHLILANSNSRNVISALAAGDIDGDTNTDVAALDSDGMLRLFLGDGQGRFAEEQSSEVQPLGTGCRGYHVRLVDLNADRRDERQHQSMCRPIFGMRPNNPGYFGGGVANNRNELWGDYFLINPGQNFAQGEALVALEASATAFVPGEYTFYSRLVFSSAVDGREPLATNWAASYAQESGGKTTDLLVWRDPTVPATNPFPCFFPGPFQFFPLSQTDIVTFDSEENPTDIPPANLPFPGVAGRARVGGPDLPVSPRSGWVYLNLNTVVPGGQVPQPASQSYVTVIRSSEGRFSGGQAGIPLDEANDLILSPLLP